MNKKKLSLIPVLFFFCLLASCGKKSQDNAAASTASNDTSSANIECNASVMAEYETMKAVCRAEDSRENAEACRKNEKAFLEQHPKAECEREKDGHRSKKKPEHGEHRRHRG